MPFLWTTIVVPYCLIANPASPELDAGLRADTLHGIMSHSFSYLLKLLSDSGHCRCLACSLLCSGDNQAGLSAIQPPRGT